jgi:hypothetical protein
MVGERRVDGESGSDATTSYHMQHNLFIWQELCYAIISA